MNTQIIEFREKVFGNKFNNMKKLQAVNQVIILEKDRSSKLFLEETIDTKNMTQIPEPYTGYVDSIGFETDEYKIGEHLAFCDIGGAYVKIGDREYVVLTPDMIIGKMEE